MKCPPSTSTSKKEVKNITKMENTKEMNLNTTLQYMYIKDRTWTCMLSFSILALMNCQICICYLYWKKWGKRGGAS